MTKTEIALLRWGQLPMFAAIVGWILGFVGVAAGLWRPQWYWVLYFIATVAMTALCIQQTNAARDRYIREAPLPRFLQRKLREAYPQLSAKDGELVERGLRQFFLACLRSRQFVAMPSQAVDVLWHEFILHTQAYQRWCTHALGRFLHHTPAEALGRKGMHNDGLRRAWFWACKEESIDPKAPSRLPLLFALDAKFAIPNGFHYVPDCRLTGAQSSSAANSSSGGCGGSPPTAAPIFRMAATAAARATLAEPTARTAVAVMEAATAEAVAGAAIEPHKASHSRPRWLHSAEVQMLLNQ